MKRLLPPFLILLPGLLAASPPGEPEALADMDEHPATAAHAPAAARPGDFFDELHAIQRAWAIANYRTPDDRREAAFARLLEQVETFRRHHPDRAEPRIWEAIVRGGYAGAMGGLSALFKAMPQMEKGRDLLLEAVEIDPRALDGSAWTTLGVFYHKVPGGLIGFGDDDKALEYLRRALEIDPDGMGPNYFMAEYWADRQQCDKALPHLEKVLAAPPVPGRPVYTEGRKAEAKRLLARCRASG